LLKHLKNGLRVLAGVSLAAVAAMAQIQVGSNLHLTASGNLSAGYSANYGDQSPSAHEFDVGGDASVNGYYFAPSFVSFNVMPYYNQSRANSNYQSISDSSGVNSSADLFTGTHFPGSIGYTKNYNSTGSYGIVGTPNFTTHGNGQGYSIAWSALEPGLPTLSVTYMAGSGSSDIYGTSAQSSSSNNNLNLRSTYTVAGFRLNGYFNHGSTHGNIPVFLSGVSDETSNSSSHSEGFDLGHLLPWNGSFSASYLRSSYSSHYLGTNSSGNTTDTVTTTASFRPTLRLSLSTGMTYSDNLAGSLNQQITAAGGSPVTITLGADSHSINVNGGLSYAITRDLGFQANVNHVDQYYSGSNQGATYLSGTMYYNRKLFNLFTFSVTALDSATDTGNSAFGVQGNVTAGRKFGAWETSGTFSYGQNVQTLLATYTTSYMSYNASLGRRLTRRLSWNSGFSGSHSGFSQQAGTSSHNESYFTSLGYRMYNLSGGYSTSNGVSVLTANGLSSAGITAVISPLDQVSYNGRSYNVAASATPIKKLVLGASYANSRSDTSSSTISSLNRTTSLNSQARYQFRRMGIMAGYTKFWQGISASGVPAAGVSSYYVGISRWVNIF